MDRVVIYIDGSSQGNPGPSGVGIVVNDADGKELGIFSEFIGEKTNNQAEYIALLYAVEIVKVLNIIDAIIYTDSELLSKQICGEYKVKNDKIRYLIKKFFKMKEGLNVDVVFLGRDANKMADVLAKDASFGLVRNTLSIKLSKILNRKGD